MAVSVSDSAASQFKKAVAGDRVARSHLMLESCALALACIGWWAGPKRQTLGFTLAGISASLQIVDCILDLKTAP